MKQTAVLLVDLPSHVEQRLRVSFAAVEAEVTVVQGVREALEFLRTRPVSILAAVHETLSAPGMDLASRALRLRPQVVVIAVGDLSREETEEAFRSGIFEVISTDGAQEADSLVLRSVLQSGKLDELQRLREVAKSRAGVGGLVGRTELLRGAREEIVRLAREETPVLLVGEPGTGREHGARFLHAASRRSSGPFLVLDSRAESAVGADRRDGPWERGAGGTLFFRDLCEWSPGSQERLEASLSEGTSSLGPRVVAACTLEPDAAEHLGRLTSGLRRTFGDSVVVLPPLRERAEDVPFLVSHFLESISQMNEIAELKLSSEARDVLASYHWPGNVRELRAAVEHAALVCQEGVIRPRDLPEAIRRAVPGRLPGTSAADTKFRDAKRDVVERFEKEYLEELLERHAGNVTEAAAASGMMRSALQRLLRKHRIRSSAFRSGRGFASGYER
jgi:DNA-binding NtrC family response regulator